MEESKSVESEKQNIQKKTEENDDQLRFEIKSLWILYILPVLILVINCPSTKVFFLRFSHVDTTVNSNTFFRVFRYILYFLQNYSCVYGENA